ncbi:hypothetical protein MJ565_10720 [Klebsiella pneumoniae]|nr:hypothetical protein MJ565_10720 [Klebsiella pneumoniae]
MTTLESRRHHRRISDADLTPTMPSLYVPVSSLHRIRPLRRRAGKKTPPCTSWAAMPGPGRDKKRLEKVR